MTRKLAAGNWKMNGTSADLDALRVVSNAHPDPSVDVLICLPATLIDRARGAAGDALALGGQDCHAETAGAHTGDVSAAMLADAGATYVIVGHSERRADHGETDAQVRAKAQAAVAAGLTAIVCIGETLEERDAGRAVEVVETQLAGSVPDGATGATIVVAYEPVWAIGTGRVPTPEQIGEIHGALRDRLAARFGASEGAAIRLLYGGSVKGENAAEIFAVPQVDGALVGGASLTAEAFGPIVTALEAAAAS